MNTSTTYGNNVNNVNNTAPLKTKARKFKPYRNRPSKRQTILELLSFGLILAAAPAFLGGVFSIFVCFFTLILGLIGLFAWTRRHAMLFTLLSLMVIGACVVNIILRALFVGQCMPYFYYADQFSERSNNSTQVVTNGNDTTVVTTDSDSTRFYNWGSNENGNDDRDNTYNNSIWCGNRYIVYITHAIILALAVPAMLCALATLLKRKQRTQAQLPYYNDNRNVATTETKTF